MASSSSGEKASRSTSCRECRTAFCDCQRQSSHSRSGTSAQAGWRSGFGRWEGGLGGSSPSANSLPFAMETTEDPSANDRPSWSCSSNRGGVGRGPRNVSGHGRFVGFYAIDGTSKGQMRLVAADRPWARLAIVVPRPRPGPAGPVRSMSDQISTSKRHSSNSRAVPLRGEAGIRPGREGEPDREAADPRFGRSTGDVPGDRRVRSSGLAHGPSPRGTRMIRPRSRRSHPAPEPIPWTP